MGRLAVLCAAMAVLAFLPVTLGFGTVSTWYSYSSNGGCTDTEGYLAEVVTMPSDGTCFRNNGYSYKLTCTGAAWSLEEYYTEDCTFTPSTTTGTTASTCSTAEYSSYQSRQVDCSVTALPAQWKETRYETTGCAGTIDSVTTRDIGRCIVSRYGSTNTSSQLTCDSNGLYQISYADDSCTTPNSISRTRTATCQQTRTGRWETRTCTGGSSTFDYPPDNSIVSTSYQFTNGSTPYFCGESATVIVDEEEATPTGACEKYTDGIWASNFCSANDAFMATLIYTDSACSVANVIAADIEPTGCNARGRERTCIGAANIPVELPTIGYVDYDRSDCSIRPGDVPTISVIKPDTCIFGRKYTCTTDAATGTQAFVETRWNNNDCTGSSSGTSTYAGDASTCTDGKKYACAFVSGGVGGIVGIAGDTYFNPAGSASAGFLASAPSVFASLFVVAAVFAQRML